MEFLDKIDAVDDYVWLVINTLTGKEEYVKKYLEHIAELSNYDFKLILPKRKILIRRRGQYIEELKVIFRGYLFLLINPDSNPDLNKFLYEIERIRTKNSGLIKILRDKQNANPLIVKKEEVKFLKSLLDTENVIDYTFGVKVGDEVRIISGPFKDQISKIVKIDYRKFRIKVKLNFLGEQVVDFAFNYVEAIKK